MRKPAGQAAVGERRAERGALLPCDARLRRGGQQHEHPVHQMAQRYRVHAVPAPPSGRSTSNVIPPSGRIAAVIQPPCASSVRLAIASPSPVPFALSEKKG